ncbi:MAG TPA: SRPBCC family protein [Thermoanaerobaculia bacterium]|nr:SRPBCC family protein [Thermoanaerobaculia bacterium]
MSAGTLPPILMSVLVPLSPAGAFELFTARIGEWWPLATISIASANGGTCFIEPFAGGRVFERANDGGEHEWGNVVAWEPPHRFAMTWHPGGKATTEVEVRFTAADEGTFVELEHRGWEAFGEDADSARDNYANGWPLVFTRCYGEAAGIGR